MVNPSEFRELVSGRRRGLKAFGLRAALRALEVPYGLVVRWRNRRFDRLSKLVTSAGVPVVSVGNLTVGGTGKSPMVRWLAEFFRQASVRVAVLSRGYKAEEEGVADEALELEQCLPDVPHLENPDRLVSARLAVDELDMQVLVLDDAFQHRRIARDLDIVLLDALEPFGFDHLLPRGTLREPVSSLNRADIVVLSRAEMLDALGREHIRRRVESISPKALWAEVTHAPRALVRMKDDGDLEQLPIETFKDRPVAAFCGLGNPAGFQHTLGACGYKTLAFREFPDHHRYDRADVESLSAWAEGLDVEAIVCTHKDLVKLGVDRLGRKPLWALSIGIEFLAGQTELEERLAVLVSK